MSPKYATEEPNASLLDMVLPAMLLLPSDVELSIVPSEVISRMRRLPWPVPYVSSPGMPTTMSTAPLLSMSPIAATEAANMSSCARPDSADASPSYGIECRADTEGCGEPLYPMTYPVMALPPLSMGIVQVSSACESPTTTSRSVGSLG